MMPPLSTILKKKRAQRDAGIVSNDEEKNYIYSIGKDQQPTEV